MSDIELKFNRVATELEGIATIASASNKSVSAKEISSLETALNQALAASRQSGSSINKQLAQRTLTAVEMFDDERVQEVLGVLLQGPFWNKLKDLSKFLKRGERTEETDMEGESWR